MVNSPAALQGHPKRHQYAPPPGICDNRIALPSQEIWWRHTQALLANGQDQAARMALERAYDFLLEGIANVRDEGLRRNYLNKVAANRELLQFWVKDGRKRKLPRKRLFAHLAIESSLREPFQRLADTGLRLNALHSLAEIQTFLVEEATELSGAERVLLILEKDGKKQVAESAFPYLLGGGGDRDAGRLLRLIETHLNQVRLTRNASLVLPRKSGLCRIIAPLIAQNQVIGYLYVDMDSIYGAFNETDRDMLGMLANQAAVALDNAQWTQSLELKVLERTDALNARVDELAILNSVGEAMAKTLDVKTVTRIVGDKVRDIFHAEVVGISLLNARTNLIHSLYEYDAGEGGYVDYIEPFPLGKGLTTKVIQAGRPLLLGTVKEQAAQGAYTTPEQLEKSSGAIAESLIMVPIIVGEKILGVATVAGYKQNAFTENDLRLLQTLSANMGVAIQNARLFEAEQQRVAEMQIINGIQQGLAAELDFQAIVDLVGDRLRQVLGTGDLGIAWYDEKTNLVHSLYDYEHGKRITALPPQAPRPGGVHEMLNKTRQPLVYGTAAEGDVLSPTVPGTDTSKSGVFLPIISNNRVVGSIRVENYERENAFGEAELRLLTTVAGSLGAALENARLFDETQKLFKAEQERAAELQIINSIQQGLAAELDFQAIVDLVGDKLRTVFDTPDLYINWYDEKTDLVHFLYCYEHGKRLVMAPIPLRPDSIIGRILKTRQPMVWDTMDEGDKIAPVIPGTDASRSGVSVPIISSDRVLGTIQIENYVREHAYGESQLRLLTTIAASLGSSLENARLFNETQRLLKETEQRAAELSVINSIQQGLAAELDFRAIVDLVGDKLRQVLNTGEIGIRWHEPNTEIVHSLYEYEHGKRINIPDGSTTDNHIAQLQLTRKPFIFNTFEEARKFGLLSVPGTDQSKSGVIVPILGSDRVLGHIITENYERENAYSESDIRLLTTVASSMGVALENARLFNETQRLLKETEQRAAELSVINSVQAALASKLDMQAIYDLVGEKIRQIFDAQVTIIGNFNHKTEMESFHYNYEKGRRLYPDPIPFTGLVRHLIRTRQPLWINEGWAERAAELGTVLVPGTEVTKSVLYMPMLVGEVVQGMISLQNIDHENAFSEADVHLLTTLASSMSVALENARLFNETQRLLKETDQRAAELAIINSVQEGLASKLDLQAIYDLVGDKIYEILDAQGVNIMEFNQARRETSYVYLMEKGKRFHPKSRPFTRYVEYLIRTNQPVLMNDNVQQRFKELGVTTLPDTEPSKSYLGVPLSMGSQVKWAIGVFNTDRENAFNDSHVRLLTTLANSMGVALENARLFNETQRLLKETEQRAAELAVINSVQAALAAELNIQGIYDTVGDKIREIFHNTDMGIRIYDPATNLESFPFTYENGKRISLQPDPLPEKGMSTHVYRTRETIVINQNMKQETGKYGSYTMPGTQTEKSAVFVPLVVGDQARGLINLIDMQRENAFSESDVRLLQTLANSMSVALENARLFDETQRLLKETEQRNSELAIINSVQHGLASKLDFQAIVDLVGDKLREVFNTPDLGINWYEEKTNLIHYLYSYEHGQRLSVPAMPPLPDGLFETMRKTRQPVIINTQADYAKVNISVIEGTDQGKSMATVPIISSDHVLGTIQLENYEREYAYGESELRLLTTIAASLGSALDNAYLFNETQRLLKETEQHAAELAVINTVQASLASELNMQGIYDAVGDKIRTIFNQADVSIRIYDSQTGMIHFPYSYDNGQRLVIESHPLRDKGFNAHVLRTRETLVINERYAKGHGEIWQSHPACHRV